MSEVDEMQDDYVTKYLTVEEIFSDDTFNCRGSISPIDVNDLATDIKQNKLQFPISVQPAEDVNKELPEGKTHRIVAGHRRFKAWNVLYKSWEPGNLAPGNLPWDASKGNPYARIPVMVKSGLTEKSARLLNLGENLKRKNLNILQEARAIEHLCDAGIPRDHVAQELGVSSGWVQTRYYLLALPPELQEEAAADLINQAQIKQLYSLRHDQEKQFEAVKAIKNARANGEKLGHVGKRKKEKVDVKKERKRPEMFEMIEILAKSTGYGLHTRALAWASGQITTEEYFGDITKFCDEHGRPKPVLPREF